MTPVTIRNDYDTSYTREWFIIVMDTLNNVSIADTGKSWKILGY
jgi:hypothetical protein